MKLGIFGINMGPLVEPDAVTTIARHAEEGGVESLWTAEHVVLPDPQAPPSPAPPKTPILDPAVALTFVAAATTRILLGTGIIILPQRNPVVLAKELASLDRLSGGRLIFGIGIGYLEPEFRAIGASYERKGPRAREYLAAMRSLWEDDAPQFEGEFVRFAGVQQRPRPRQKPIPVVFGGHSAPAYRRAVELAHGWYGFGLDVEQTRGHLDGLRNASARVERPEALGELEITVTPRAPLTREDVDRYRELGVHRLVPMLLTADLDDARKAIDGYAAALPNEN